LRPPTRLVAVTTIVALGFVVAVFVLRHASEPHGNTQKVNQLLAPDFTLPTLDGQEVRLSSYRGKVVLLDFWATWCDPCREETPHFVQLQKTYGDRGLQIIGISMDDSPEPVRPFYQQFHMNYPVVMGTAKTGELYGGILGLPTAFLIGRDGRIDAKLTGATDAAVFEKNVKKLIETR